MIIISDTQARFAMTVGSIFLGIILLVFGYIAGNQPVIQADLRAAKEFVWENKIKNEKLADWIISGKRGFFLIGFRNEKDCVLQRERTKFFVCFPQDKLEDIRWLRAQFPNLLVPMVIYGKNANESFEIAARLRYFGYNARMLEDGFDGFDKLYLMPVQLKGDEDVTLKEKIIRKQRLYQFFTGNKLPDSESFIPISSPQTPKKTRYDSSPAFLDPVEEGC